jgi:oligopeptide/dipeptide ABC transporter ATP-binding protein
MTSRKSNQIGTAGVGNLNGARNPLLSVRELRTVFHAREGTVVAVDGISFDVYPGEVFSIVGESGSGKSVTAMSIMQLINPPGEIVSGQILLEEVDMIGMSKSQLRKLRGAEMSMIFQDPMTSLNPVYTIGNQLGEPLKIHKGYGRKEALEASIAALAEVGIPNPKDRIRDYPHQFSGGMLQRVAIAMAMITKPKLVIADEPTTALDVTIQAQILDLLLGLSQTHGTSIVLITHDLGVVANVSDRTAVMYAGQIHEAGTTSEVFENPHGPYVWGLLDSIPRLEGDVSQKLAQITGQPPSPSEVFRGCHFGPRCPYQEGRCIESEPTAVSISPGHTARCHFAGASGWPKKRTVSAREPSPNGD